MLRVEPLIVEKDLSIVALVGDHMKSHPGISGKMFGALGRNGVNVRAIAQGSSERNISAVVSTADVRKAINVLHEEFFETSYKQINIFIAGAGNVGSKLIAPVTPATNIFAEIISACRFAWWVLPTVKKRSLRMRELISLTGKKYWQTEIVPALSNSLMRSLKKIFAILFLLM